MTIDWKEGVLTVVVLLIVSVGGFVSVPYWKFFVGVLVVWWFFGIASSMLKKKLVRRRARVSIVDISKRFSD